MAYIIPGLAITSGVGLVIWGVNKIFSKDDSADQKAAKTLSSVPDKFRKFISKIEFQNGRLTIALMDNTPQNVKDEFTKEIKILNPKD